MSTGTIMETGDFVAYLPNVNDGTGANPQEGYFVIRKAIGPFNTREDAMESLRTKECE